ncbi:hypothetical protein I8751_08785 [Nostocaceae cyanobacterium CENA357]|uniref:Uncharacterized protein n=1 Tax=Atlanticothrix silvestris CENA357 TaxID=1725252 RepID=A0A8J7HGI7_9CYAN|nr:hypothetical protein [Atlanticothrix silvestris]MBH8552469.1 hypothetical protein [Atlanticothrix silvestris CENA357]
MNNNFPTFRKYAGLLGAVCGGLLIGTPVIPKAAVAQQTTRQVNPCPSIYYEEPHNNRVLTPRGCPPNALTRRLAAQGTLPMTPAPAPTSSSPYQGGMSVGGETPQSTTPGINPCPRIYYEEPFNTRNVVPQGCPPNALTQQLQTQGFTPGVVVPVRPEVSVPQPPLPSQRQAPSTKLALANGKVNIKLINNTGANVTYQAIGDTQPRTLEGQSNVMLQGLNAPTTLTFYRNDRGLLQVIPQSTSTPGMLEVTLDATTDPGMDKGTVRVQEDGTVFVN